MSRNALVAISFFTFVMLSSAGPARGSRWTRDALLYDTSSVEITMGVGNRNQEKGLALRLYGVEAGWVSEESYSEESTVDPLGRVVADPSALARRNGFYVGLSPFTWGSWFNNPDPFMPVAYLQPFVQYKNMETTTGGTDHRDASLVLGSRSYLATAGFRLGLQAQVEAGGHELGNDVTIGFFVGSGNGKPPFGKDGPGGNYPEGIKGTLLGLVGIAALAVVYAGADYVCEKSAGGC